MEIAAMKVFAAAQPMNWTTLMMDGMNEPRSPNAGRVSANGRPVKASYDVKVGDVLEIQFGQKTLKVEVLVVADNVHKDDAPAMYREIG